MLILLGQAGLFYWILDGCGASLSFLEVAVASILVHLAGVIPAPTMGNVGTHEMAWTVIFKSFACSNPIALLSALLSQWLTLFFAYLWGFNETFFTFFETLESQVATQINRPKSNCEFPPSPSSQVNQYFGQSM